MGSGMFQDRDIALNKAKDDQVEQSGAILVVRKKIFASMKIFSHVNKLPTILVLQWVLLYLTYIHYSLHFVMENSRRRFTSSTQEVLNINGRKTWFEGGTNLYAVSNRRQDFGTRYLCPSS